MLFLPALGCGITMIVLAIYMYFVKFWKENDLPPQHSWIPIVSIFVFVIACTLGYLIVPWVMIGEVYPTQVSLIFVNYYITGHKIKIIIPEPVQRRSAWATILFSRSLILLPLQRKRELLFDDFTNNKKKTAEEHFIIKLHFDQLC